MALVLVAGPARAAQGVGLKVVVVQASEAPGEPDPALAGLQADLQKTFGGYKSFKQLDKSELKLQQGTKVTLKLPNGKEAEFTYQGEKNGRHYLALAIPADKVTTTVSGPLHKLFYQALTKRGGGALILAFLLTPP